MTTRITLLLVLFLPVLLFAQRHTEFSLQNATAIERTLSVDIGPRPMGSPAEHRGLEFAVSKFKEYGCDTAYIMPMLVSTRANTTSGIAIGIKHGATNRMIVLGGHMDSAGPEIPGADDDGSGSAVVIELARVLARRQIQSTMVFCCYGGEEQGLEGSKYFVDHFSDIDSVAFSIQNDMANGLGVIDLDPETRGMNAPQWLVKAAVEEFFNLGYSHLRYPAHFFAINYSQEEASGSDHESFLQRGIPAIDFTTDVNKPIHTPRDNFENFDPRGLQRSGDVTLKLVERFDNGVPPGKIDRYWMYLLGSTPIFLPWWGLWIVYGLMYAIGVIAVFAAYGRRMTPAEPRIRNSGLKMLLFTMVVVACGWFSSDLVGLIKGVRHPWFISIGLYEIYAFIASLIGIWLVAQWSRRLPITRQPLPLFRQAIILLLIFFTLLSIVNIKLGLYPALGILILSLAMLSRRPSVKYLLMILAPLPILRLIFSEWADLFIRSLAMALPADKIAASLLYDGVMIMLFTLAILPFMLGAAAIIRDTPEKFNVVPWLRSKQWIFVAAGLFIVMTVFLALRPSYDSYWFRDLRVNQRYNMDSSTFTNRLQSGEYLSGLRIHHGMIDTTITGHTCAVSITPRSFYDTSWLSVTREEHKIISGDTTKYDLLLTLNAAFRPYTVTLSYRGGKSEPLSFHAGDWMFRTLDKVKTKEVRWYSFPDSHLVVPIRFQVLAGDSVRETLSVAFDSLAYPMTFQHELTYVLPRTEYAGEKIYK